MKISSTTYQTHNGYELSDHLGNVRVVLTDKRVSTYTSGFLTSVSTDISSWSDYFSFGWEIPGRSLNITSSRYGFNGMEKDDEVKGISGSSYDFGARMLDVRVGRWFNRDPMEHLYASWSTYNFTLNNPIKLVDEDGKQSTTDIGKLEKHITSVFDKAPKEEASLRILRLQQSMNATLALTTIDNNFEYYKDPIKGPDFLANESGAFSGNSMNYMANIQIYGKIYDGTVLFQKKIDKKLYRVSGIEFDAGKEGKGVTGGLISSLHGFEIRLYNEDNTVLSIIIKDKTQFNGLVNKFFAKTDEAFKKILDTKPKLRDFFEVDQLYKEVNSLYAKTLKAPASDPVHKEYATKSKLYIKKRDDFYRKYRK